MRRLPTAPSLAPAFLALALGTVFLPLSPFSATVASAQEARTPREPIISVSGEGKAAVAPDMAILSLAVVRQAKTADAAVSANNTAMSEVLAAIKAEGIADRDVQTSSFAIYPQYRQVAPKDGIEPPQEIIGYEVSNTLTLKVRDLEKLGGLIDKTVKLGVNQGGQIEFTNTNTDEVMTQARKAAVAEALAKAKTLTEAAGVKLGRIMEISENSAPPMAPPMMRMTMAKDSGNGVPVAAGETSYTVNVNVVFSIDP